MSTVTLHLDQNQLFSVWEWLAGTNLLTNNPELRHFLRIVFWDLLITVPLDLI